jgi:hypothetical protein
MTLKLLITKTVLLAVINFSCSQNRTYLTDLEKAWNPYKEGQVLVFGTSNGLTDTLEITKAEDKQFADGIGAPGNERLNVLVRLHNLSVSKNPIEVTLFNISSKSSMYPTNIDFELLLQGGRFWGRAYSIKELEQYAEFSIETPFRKFDDVIMIEDNSNRVLNEYEIKTIYWSKTFGYVKCERKDGTVWDLVNIVKSRD